MQYLPQRKCVTLFPVYEGSVDDSIPHDEDTSPDSSDNNVLPLQLAIVGRPNVGKSTLLNALLQEERVLVGPEAGLTRDSIRAEFQFEGKTVYLVNLLFQNVSYFSSALFVFGFLWHFLLMGYRTKEFFYFSHVWLVL